MKGYLRLRRAAHDDITFRFLLGSAAMGVLSLVLYPDEVSLAATTVVVVLTLVESRGVLRDERVIPTEPFDGGTAR